MDSSTAPPASTIAITQERTTGRPVKDGQNDLDPSVAPETRTKFLTTDESVSVWFCMEKALPGDALVLDWVGPGLAPRQELYVDSSGSRCLQWSLANLEAGDWTAQLGVNGKEAFAVPFRIAAPD